MCMQGCVYLSDKGDSCASVVDLPHIEFFILLKCRIKLSWSETSRHTPVFCISHAYRTHFPTFRHQLTHQRKDHISRTLGPRHTDVQTRLIKNMPKKIQAHRATNPTNMGMKPTRKQNRQTLLKKYM